MACDLYGSNPRGYNFVSLQTGGLLAGLAKGMDTEPLMTVFLHRSLAILLPPLLLLILGVFSLVSMERSMSGAVLYSGRLCNLVAPWNVDGHDQSQGLSPR
jgi:hypothetical protein